jgi:hypothetical protein
MMTWPDINEKIAQFGGSLFPFNWAKLLWWLRAPKVSTMRVPLMGVMKKLQSTRMASQLAFMMVSLIRDAHLFKLECWGEARARARPRRFTSASPI